MYRKDYGNQHVFTLRYPKKLENRIQSFINKGKEKGIIHNKTTMFRTLMVNFLDEEEKKDGLSN